MLKTAAGISEKYLQNTGNIGVGDSVLSSMSGRTDKTNPVARTAQTTKQ